MYDDVKKSGSDKPRWFHIFDAQYRRSSVAGPLAPGKVVPDSQIPRRYRDGKFVYKAETLDELATKLDLSMDALKATLDRFNEHAVKGQDPDFNRGHSAQDRYYGDPNVKPIVRWGRCKKRRSMPLKSIRVISEPKVALSPTTTDAFSMHRATRSKDSMPRATRQRR